MDIVTLLFIAFGLSMDAFAVSIANGIAPKRQRLNDALLMATFFGGFQAFMPVIGWLAGLGLAGLISGVDHWVAFGLLALVGGKMIYESVRASKGEKKSNGFSLSVLLVLAVATSIDALAVGLSFAFLEVAIVTPVVVIGTVTFLLSFLGVVLGDRISRVFGRRVEVVAGLVLIGIGIRIVIEHSL